MGLADQTPHSIAAHRFVSSDIGLNFALSIPKSGIILKLAEVPGFAWLKIC